APPPQRQPKPKQPKPPRGARRPVWPWVLVGALLLGLVAGAIVGLTGGNKRLPETTAQEPAVTTTPTLPPTLVPQGPQTLDQLIALLAANPTKYGTRGTELLSRLLSFRTSPSSAGASRLISDITTWTSRGELDRTIGTAAIRILTPSARPPNDNQDEGNGQGN